MFKSLHRKDSARNYHFQDEKYEEKNKRGFRINRIFTWKNY